MKSGISEVQSGVDNANLAGKSLKKIVDSVAQVTTMVENVATTTARQKEDVSRVERNIARNHHAHQQQRKYHQPGRSCFKRAEQPVVRI